MKKSFMRIISMLLVITLLLPITTDFLTSYTAFADDISISEGAAAEEKEDYSEWLIKAGNWGDPIGDGLIPPWGYFHKKVQEHIMHTYSDIHGERTYSNGRADLYRDILDEKANDYLTTYILVVRCCPNSPLRTIYGTDGDDYMAAMDDRGVILYGESGADNLNGGSGVDKLYGGSGNDQLYGNGGNDTLDGGEGDDMLYGGAGNDTYIFNVVSGIDTIIDSEGINTISFGAGLAEDIMTAYRHNWNDLMITFEDVEDKLIIQGYFGSDSNRNFEVRFAGGTRYAYDDAENPIKQVYATEYDDWMTAWSDNGISLHGDGGNDNLTGGAGDDTLFGGIGNDTLIGNDSEDILDGGEGNDFLYGGLGNDIYRFSIGYGSDIIEDNDDDNKVELLGINSDAVLFEMTDNEELVITITESGDILTIRNFDSERFAFKFADEVSGTFNVEIGEFERILSAEELAAIEAANAENEIYTDDYFVAEQPTENDSTVTEVTDNVSIADINNSSTDSLVA